MTQELKPEEYTFEFRDEFKRRPFAEKLINLILGDNDFFPLAITGQWGTGKTEFCKKTVNLINNKYSNNLIAEYLNAFAEDSYNDPLLSITSTICKTFIKDESKRNAYFKRFAKALIPHLGTSTVKILFPPLSPVVESLKDAITQANRENVSQNLESRTQIESSIQELKTLISEVSDGKTFILFIDELDRCRPDFALHTLEVVKHIFGTKNLKIVFVLNRAQLIEIIKHSYGDNEQIAEKYLDKFFQIHLKLPELPASPEEEQIQNSSKYLDILFNEKKVFDLPLFDDGPYLGTTCKGKKSQTAHLLRELTEYHNLSFRDVEKLSNYITLYEQFHPHQPYNFVAYSLIEAYAIFHFSLNKTIMQNIKNKRPLLEKCNDTLVTEKGSRIFARHLLRSSLHGDAKNDFWPYIGDDPLEKRVHFLSVVLHNLDNLLLQ